MHLENHNGGIKSDANRVFYRLKNIQVALMFALMLTWHSNHDDYAKHILFKFNNCAAHEIFHL